MVRGAVAFFRGGLSGEGAHDHLAQEIAENGRSWAQNYFVCCLSILFKTRRPFVLSLFIPAMARFGGLSVQVPYLISKCNALG